MKSLEKKRYTPEQYLAIERTAAVRSEYIAGEIVAMAGASRRHSLIKSNVALHIGNHLAGKPCETHSSDQRVQVGSSYFYPDILVVCGEVQLADNAHQSSLVNPSVIVEVLSKSTEGYDRGVKFEHYAQIDSLTDYVLVSQDSYRVEHFARRADGEWPAGTVLTTEDGVLHIESIGCRLRMAEIYDQVRI